MKITTTSLPTVATAGAVATPLFSLEGGIAARDERLHPTAQAVAHPRHVERIFAGHRTSDGAGVQLVRVLGQDLQRRLDPFLMLDAFGTDEPQDDLGGFPDHPHRGFETVTYMLAGRMRHRDSAGNEGLLEAGGLQWMTAGRGVIHSEMPEQEKGRMEGFQLWLNLAASDKMTAPTYRDIPAAQVPEWRAEGGSATARVLAGEAHGVAGAVRRERTEPLLLDVALAPGGRFEQPLAEGCNAFVYVYRGAVAIGDSEVPAQRMAILANGAGRDGVVLRASAGEAARLLIVAGAPLHEPIVQHGPFVMNRVDEVRRAVEDFRSGRFG